MRPPVRPPEFLSVLFQYRWEAWEVFVLPGWLYNFQEKRQSKDSSECFQFAFGGGGDPPTPTPSKT